MHTHSCDVPAKGIVACRYNQQIREVNNFATTSPSYTTEVFTEKIEALRLRILEIYKSADHLYIDTCSLMRSYFVSMLTSFGEDLMKANVKFEIFPQVVLELKKLATSENEDTRMGAIRALKIMASSQYSSLFTLAQTDMDSRFADRVICREMFNRSYTEKQILITQDSKLAAAIFNLCAVHTEQETTVYRLNKHGFLFGFELEYLELAPHVNIPAHYQEALTAFPRTIQQTPPYATSLAAMLTTALKETDNPPTYEPRKERPIAEYFNDAIVNGVIYMSHDALVSIFGQDGNPALLARLQELHFKGHPVCINVLSLSLTKWLKERMEPWQHLFRTIRPTHALMSEEDALLSAMCTEYAQTDAKHQLLISKEASLYQRISKRVPKCYSVLEIWGTCLNSSGYLLDARHISNTSTKTTTNYAAAPQQIA